MRTIISLSLITLLSTFGAAFGEELYGPFKEKPTPTPKPFVEKHEEIRPMFVSMATMCEKVEKRKPIGSCHTFPVGLGTISYFTSVMMAMEPQKVTHEWYYKGAFVQAIELNVEAVRWRTWSTKTLSPKLTGKWMVRCITEQGEILDERTFIVTNEPKPEDEKKPEPEKQKTPKDDDKPLAQTETPETAESSDT